MTYRVTCTAEGRIGIDDLIGLVARGASVKTGVDIYNRRGVLLLQRDVQVETVKTLETIKKNGIESIPISPENAGGLWDENGNWLSLEGSTEPMSSKTDSLNVTAKLAEIAALKKEAAIRYQKAKGCIKKVIQDIQQTGGEFDYDLLEKTVSELLSFLADSPNSFSYVTREIFSYDDYLYNHSINVCTIGTAILNHFNGHFGRIVNDYLGNLSLNKFEGAASRSPASFIYYQSEELHDIALGFFLHDVGKVLVPKELLNKKGRLTPEEFETVKTHAFEKGMQLMHRNGVSNPYVCNVVKYHHSALFEGEPKCYPQEKIPAELPPYVKVCKLADIYDAMTSKRSYKAALNPIGVVTEIFRTYAEKDPLLQVVLHSFVKSVGIYPPGSIARMVNGQIVYILDAHGPIGIPITDKNGETLKRQADPVDLNEARAADAGFQIDRREALIDPVEAYAILPDYLKESIARHP